MGGACDRRCRGDQADHEDHPRSHAADEREEGEEEGREEAEEGQEEEEAEEEKEEEGQEAEEEEKEEEKEEEGSLPGRQAQEGPAQEQGFGRGWQEEGCGQGPLQGSHVQRRADRHHGQ